MTETDARPTQTTPEPREKPWYVRDYSAEKPTVTVHPDAVTDRQGREFVLYWGLLDAAHRAGLRSIQTTLVQAPTDLNGRTAIVHATVEFGWGSYTGLGDADPGNVTRMIIPHLIRMAETRAKARALRDAINIKMVALEELGPDRDEHDDRPNGGTGGGAAPRRVAAPDARAPQSDQAIAAANAARQERPADGPLVEGQGADPDAAEALAKYERLLATANRLAQAGKLTLAPDLAQPFREGVRAIEVEARCQRLVTLINSVVAKRPASSPAR